MSQKIISVGEVSQYIRRLFADDYFLKRIAVSGEVSNLTYHRSGHIYFTLKDETAALSCVMWAGDRAGLGFPMKNGDRVVVTGSVDVYMQQGRYQLYARKIELQGAGLLYERYLALKAELEEMGMFAEEYKQPIPFYVKRLGIVTAPTGAAVQDIRNIAYRRNPYVQLILYPALVQGEGAAESIVRGIRTLDALGLDCLIVGRGGGSIEDLWAFNEEPVARAIFDCSTPVISAVGHETDTTIADLVADLRAPTPSAAAELAVCDIRELLDRLDGFQTRLEAEARHKILKARERTAVRAQHLRHLSPESQIREKRQRTADIEEKLVSLAEAILHDRRSQLQLLKERFRGRPGAVLQEKKQQLEKYGERLKNRTGTVMQGKKHRLQLLAQTMEGLSPVRKLQQGYSYAENEYGHNVASINDVQQGDAVRIEVMDGVIHTEVTGTERRSRPGKD
ncbi:MAG: exodeoxyribonuclease VII large subunit [Eubacterium sp.]|nr:exodeoxyribonuclease VII large subunit [Eubacterium sp.]